MTTNPYTYVIIDRYRAFPILDVQTSLRAANNSFDSLINEIIVKEGRPLRKEEKSDNIIMSTWSMSDMARRCRWADFVEYQYSSRIVSLIELWKVNSNIKLIPASKIILANLNGGVVTA